MQQALFQIDCGYFGARAIGEVLLKAMPCIGEAGGLGRSRWPMGGGVKGSLVIARLEINDGYIGVGNFVHQATGEAREACLGCIVETVEGKGETGGERGHVHYGTVIGCNAVGQDFAGEADGGFEHELELWLNFIYGERLQRAKDARASVVDEDVEFGPREGIASEEGGEGGLVGEVYGKMVKRAMRCNFWSTAREGPDFDTIGNQHGGEGLAKARRGACDKGLAVFARKVMHRGSVKTDTCGRKQEQPSFS